MNEIKINSYDFKTTLLGGQSFLWDYCSKTGLYTGVVGDSVLQLKPLTRSGTEIQLLWQTYPTKDQYNLVSHYLNLSTEYDRIVQDLKKDPHLEKAIESFPGLRVLNQDFEETLQTFLLSSTKNIKAIRYSVSDLRKKLGSVIEVEGQEIYLFPTKEQIIRVSEEVLRTTKIGFRAKYLQESCKILSEQDLTKENLMHNEEVARKALTALPGVGTKIADCVMVFSLEYKHFTPLDVWGKRIVTELYKLPSTLTYEELHEWMNMYFDGHAALAGQFLFEYIRTLPR